MKKIMFGIAVGLVIVSVAGVIAGKNFNKHFLEEDIFPEDWGWTW